MRISCLVEMRVDPMEHPIWIAISKSIKMRLPLEGGKTTQICENIFHDDQINQQIVRYLTSELQSSEIRLIAAENTEFFE